MVKYHYTLLISGDNVGKLTEEQVKERLNISSFRELKKEQLIEFMSTIPDMDKETALKCIEQFPDFKEYAGNIVERYYDLCKEAIQNDAKSTIAAYTGILEDLRFMLQKEDISEDMQRFIAEQMIIVGKEIAEAEKEKRKLAHEIVRIGGALGGFALAIGGTLLGLKIKKR